MDLNDAEMSRFVDTIDWDSKVPDALKYINFHVNKLINALKPDDEDYAFLYVRYNKILNLARALLTSTSPVFEFDSRDDLLDLFNEKAKMLNQRSITDALMSHGYNKQKFLNWVDKYSKYLDRDKSMIHEILDYWDEPDVQVPADGSVNPNTANAPAASSAGNTNSSAADSEDFDSVFGADGEETDTDLFSNSTSAAGKAAKVSATDALNRIKGFDFTL
jgi:hypothetical protein